jgi:hypothetical protein
VTRSERAKPSPAFEVPRAVARALIGSAAETPLADAIDYTLATLSELARRETMAVVCRLAVPIARQLVRRAEHERRVNAYKAAVVDGCQKLHFACFDSNELAAARGLKLAYSEDGLYHDAESRAVEAHMVAELVLSGSGVRRLDTGA